MRSEALPKTSNEFSTLVLGDQSHAELVSEGLVVMW